MKVTKDWKKEIGFQVITCVGKGNYYDMLGVKKGKTVIFDDDSLKITKANLVQAKRLAFKMGEILIIYKPTGREISPLYRGCYSGRNADKWDVVYKEFSNLFKAIKFARKITKNQK